MKVWLTRKKKPGHLIYGLFGDLISDMFAMGLH